MEEIVSDACSVSCYSGGRKEKSRLHDRNLVHSDTGGRETASNENRANKKVYERSSKIECSLCRREGHRAKECKQFQALSVDDRWRKVHSLGVCRVCLFGHGRRTCRSTQRCGINGCQSRHNPLLHFATGFRPKNNLQMPVEQHVHQRDLPNLLFRILPVTLHYGGKSIQTFAFLDEGSSLTMIESSLAAKLGVVGCTRPLCLKWTGNVTRMEKEFATRSL